MKKKSLHALPKSLRPRRRYIGFVFSGQVSRDVFVQAFKRAFLEWNGLIGWAQAAPVWRVLESGQGMLRVRHRFVDAAVVALLSLPFSVRVREVRGTLKSFREIPLPSQRPRK